MRHHFLSIAKFFIGWPVAILALFFIIRLIAPQIGAIWEQIGYLNYGLFACGIGAYLVYYFLRGYLWYRLLRAYDYTISYKESTYLWSLSEIKRYIPGNIWSFLSRAVLFEKKGIKKKDTGACLVLEASLFVWGSVIVSLLSIPFIIKTFSLPLSLFWLSLLVLLGVGFYSTNQFFLKHFSSRLRHFFSFLLPKFPPVLILELLFIGTITMFFLGVGTYFTITSYILIDLQLFFALTGFSVLAFLIGYLSLLTPAGFGVREAVLLAGLTRIAGWTTAAAAFAVLFSRIMLILAELLFIGIIVCLNKKRSGILE